MKFLLVLLFVGLLAGLPALPHDHSAPHHCAICDACHWLAVLVAVAALLDPRRVAPVDELPADDHKPSFRPSVPGGCRAPPLKTEI